MIQHKIRSRKSNSVESTDIAKSLEVQLNNTSKLNASYIESGIVDSYEQFLKERSESNKYRLIFTINPYCTNVLFNPFTEITRYEGSKDVEVINGTKYADLGSNKMVVGNKKPNRFDMVQNTEYTKDEIGFEYKPGLDIFNNHILRNKTFKHTNHLSTLSSNLSNLTTNGDKINNGEVYYNTICDFMRYDDGSPITYHQRLKLPSSNNDITNSIKIKHLYDIDDLFSFEDSINANLTEDDGWFGFINSSTIGTKAMNYKRGKLYTEVDTNIGRVMNNREGCEFIDMYPDRSLFSFNPKYNKFRAREEHNWDYCITYPYENYTNNELVQEGDFNGMKIFSITKGVNSYGEDVLLIRTYIRHHLNKGDLITLYYKPKGNGEYRNIGDDNTDANDYAYTVTVKSVGDLSGNNQDYYFTINDMSFMYTLGYVQNPDETKPNRWAKQNWLEYIKVNNNTAESNIAKLVDVTLNDTTITCEPNLYVQREGGEYSPISWDSEIISVFNDNSIGNIEVVNGNLVEVNDRIGNSYFIKNKDNCPYYAQFYDKYGRIHYTVITLKEDDKTTGSLEYYVKLTNDNGDKFVKLNTISKKKAYIDSIGLLDKNNVPDGICEINFFSDRLIVSKDNGILSNREIKKHKYEIQREIYTYEQLEKSLGKIYMKTQHGVYILIDLFETLKYMNRIYGNVYGADGSSSTILEVGTFDSIGDEDLTKINNIVFKPFNIIVYDNNGNSQIIKDAKTYTDIIDADISETKYIALANKGNYCLSNNKKYYKKSNTQYKEINENGKTYVRYNNEYYTLTNSGGSTNTYEIEYVDSNRIKVKVNGSNQPKEYTIELNNLVISDRGFSEVTEDEINKDIKKYDFRYRNFRNNNESNYYFRIFRKVPNFKKAKEELTDIIASDKDKFNDYVKNNSKNKTYEDNSLEFDKKVYKLAFAKTIYNDANTQITFTDTIDIAHLLDNRGKPLTEIYFTILKRNKGYEEWYYGKDSTAQKSDIVEFSHCFGEVNSGIEISYSEFDDKNEIEERAILGDIRLCNLISSDGTEYTRGEKFKMSRLFGFKPLEVEIDSKGAKTYDDGNMKYDCFLGDIVEYNSTNYIENRLDWVSHRFNTVQREMPQSESGDNNKFDNFYYQEIVSDDYDIDGFVVENIATDGWELDFFKTKKLNIWQRPEGYYFRPFYPIQIGEMGQLHRAAHETITLKETPIFNDKTNQIILKTSLSHNLKYNNPLEIELVNGNNSEYYTLRVVEVIDNYKVCVCVNFIDAYEFNKEDTSLLYQHISDHIGNEGAYIIRIKNPEIPYYAERTNDNIFYWRDILRVGDDMVETLPEYRFINDAFYIHKQVNFFLKRQDPHNIHHMQCYNAFPNDIFGKGLESDTYNDDFKDETFVLC